MVNWEERMQNKEGDGDQAGKMGGEKVFLSQMFEYHFVGQYYKQVSTVLTGSMFF